jgi:hypothetical protein
VKQVIIWHLKDEEMPRRAPYTRVNRINEVRADHVKGMGDVVFKGFQCLNSECEEFIFVRKDSIGEIFEITCPSCGFVLRSGDETQFFSYEMLDIRSNPPTIVEDGNFTILHDDYIAEAKEYKYCLICNTLKPLDLFDRHSARQSGRQGECRLCKAVYNSIKNQTRISTEKPRKKEECILIYQAEQKLTVKRYTKNMVIGASSAEKI